MKHLNPRQGITIQRAPETLPSTVLLNACETPKSPPGDYNGDRVWGQIRPPKESVKHLNPRQGITILPPLPNHSRHRRSECVKHLNPRQGITIGSSNTRQPQTTARAWV